MHHLWHRVRCRRHHLLKCRPILVISQPRQQIGRDRLEKSSGKLMQQAAHFIGRFIKKRGLAIAAQALRL